MKWVFEVEMAQSLVPARSLERGHLSSPGSLGVLSVLPPQIPK